MVLAAYNDGLYKLLYFGHIASFVVAFAPAVVNPLLAARLRGQDSTMREVAGHLVTNSRQVHIPALVVLGGFGIALVLASGDAWGFDQLWISLAFLVWIAIAGIVTGVLLPAERKIADGDFSVAKRMEVGGQVTTVLTVVIMYLMIWKPGA